MTRRAIIGVVLLVELLVLGGLAGAQVNDDEPTVESRTFTDADRVVTIPGETHVYSFTVPTETVTVTAPTTTAPPPTTTEDDPPPTQPDIVQTTNWVCNAPQDRGLVKLTLSNAGTDAVQFRSGCTGEIDRIEVDGIFADCFKVNPPPPAAHDLVIEGGYCRDRGALGSGNHKDCIQAGGGENFLIRDFVFDCVGGGGGNYFIASFNGGTPRNFICDHCAFGPRHPNQIRTPSDPDSGVSNSLVCEPVVDERAIYLPASGDKGGNIVAPEGDPRCAFEGLLAYVDAD